VRPKTTLYCTEGGADKQYTIWVEPKGDQFVVQAQWGPRGGSVQSGTKTPVPVAEAKADAVYDKTVKEKAAKGYHPGVDAPAFSQVDGATDSGLRPMLLTDASEEGPDRFIESPEWAAQEKMNGKRIMVRASEGRVIGVNRRGLECPIPATISKTFKLAAVTLDGEMIGDVYHVFDAINLSGEDVTAATAEARHHALSMYQRKFQWWTSDVVQVVPLIFGREGKRSLTDELRDKRREGVVFKRVDAAYQPGKIENVQKAIAVKCKFYSEVAAIVRRWTDKSSIEVGLRDKEEITSVGKVTVAAKYVCQIKAGDVVRVRYLYATPNRILYQANLDPTGDGSVLADQSSPDSLASLKLEGKEEA